MSTPQNTSAFTKIKFKNYLHYPVVNMLRWHNVILHTSMV